MLKVGFAIPVLAAAMLTGAGATPSHAAAAAAAPKIVLAPAGLDPATMVANPSIWAPRDGSTILAVKVTPGNGPSLLTQLQQDQPSVAAALTPQEQSILAAQHVGDQWSAAVLTAALTPSLAAAPPPSGGCPDLNNCDYYSISWSDCLNAQPGCVYEPSQPQDTHVVQVHDQTAAYRDDGSSAGWTLHNIYLWDGEGQNYSSSFDWGYNSGGGGTCNNSTHCVAYFMNAFGSGYWHEEVITCCVLAFPPVTVQFNLSDTWHSSFCITETSYFVGGGSGSAEEGFYGQMTDDDAPVGVQNVSQGPFLSNCVGLPTP
ncbi:MAG: hypothetical protein JF886_09335 [Candidatus Dormibacteraeota bacterium]|uniref:Uncharacterized protein n=1 Tax=Candidatus Aeolococcus gillhamiae TaxID=3127015 RepID=A0A934JXZ6_9BACT|nr:hypothetical protein [Candidatus Dormibacteraeota bacterium]